MANLRILSASEQVAGHLRKEILRGKKSGVMPGEHLLVKELGVGRDTVKAALKHLEREGLLVSKGVGKRRHIQLSESPKPEGMRAGLLLFQPDDRVHPVIVELRDQLQAMGVQAVVPKKTLNEMGMKVAAIERVVRKHPADAWVVCGASLEVLRWFDEQPTPFISIAGNHPYDTPMAVVSPGLQSQIIEVERHLIELGHKRISLLTRSGVKPAYFFKELEAHGIATGPFNVPHMTGSPQDFMRALDKLFAVTPPTALIIDEADSFVAARNHLARRGIHAPEHISLVCATSDPSFQFEEPSIAYIQWDDDAIARRIARWMEKAFRGDPPLRRIYTKAKFVKGGTIGPVPGGE